MPTSLLLQGVRVVAVRLILLQLVVVEAVQGVIAQAQEHLEVERPQKVNQVLRLVQLIR
jgi:hypothetical protein